MERIFFYGNINIDDKAIGITKKVLSQINTLRNMGYEVYYSAYTKDGVAIYNNLDKKVKERKYWTNSTKLNRQLRRWNLLYVSSNYIKEATESFDYGYLRFHFFDRAYLNLLKSLKTSGASVIIEAHGYPYKPKRINTHTPIYILDTLYEPFVRKYIDLVAAISSYDNIWGCKTVQIDNAIDLNLVKLQNKKPAENGSLRLISVSNEQQYHGYPKLIRGLYDYYNKGGQRQIEINFVGEFKAGTKKLVEDLRLTDHIIFHGKKTGEELTYLYNRSDLGIGALSSRAGAEYGSSIKTKEYFALGLPFINGWKEYAFDDSYPYVKRFDLDNQKINIEEVVKFYDLIKDDLEMQDNMRRFAEKNYTWEAQFTKIMNKINKVRNE